MALPKTDDEWRAKLTPQQFKVLRQSGTEMAGTGEYNKCKDKGVYHCVGCDAPLYSSESKFDSGCGWPAFFEALPGALTIKEDFTHGMHRIEMRCAKCDGHLGTTALTQITHVVRSLLPRPHLQGRGLQDPHR